MQETVSRSAKHNNLSTLVRTSVSTDEGIILYDMILVSLMLVYLYAFDAKECCWISLLSLPSYVGVGHISSVSSDSISTLDYFK